MLGTVKWFSKEKGYGFITPENGTKDIFVHISGIVKSGLRELQEGDRVSFDLEPSKSGKGPAASNIKIV